MGLRSPSKRTPKSFLTCLFGCFPLPRPSTPAVGGGAKLPTLMGEARTSPTERVFGGSVRRVDSPQLPTRGVGLVGSTRGLFGDRDLECSLAPNQVRDTRRSEERFGCFGGGTRTFRFGNNVPRMKRPVLLPGNKSACLCAGRFSDTMDRCARRVVSSASSAVGGVGLVDLRQAMLGQTRCVAARAARLGILHLHHPETESPIE